MRGETPLEVAWDAWCADYGYLNYARSRYHELFAAGFAAGLAHVTNPSPSIDLFVCDICGQHATIGTRKADGAWEIRCPEHFPEVPRAR